MRVGINLPQIGSASTPELCVRAAQQSPTSQWHPRSPCRGPESWCTEMDRGSPRGARSGRCATPDAAGGPGLGAPGRALYWVTWKAVAARGRAERFGRLCFGVAMPVPAHIMRDIPGALSERDGDERRRRAVLVGGVLLLALGALLPRPAWRR